MSLLSRMTAPAATHDLADLVTALLSTASRTAPSNLPTRVPDRPPEPPESTGLAGLPTAAGRRLASGSTGLGTSAIVIPGRTPASAPVRAPETIPSPGRTAGRTAPASTAGTAAAAPTTAPTAAGTADAVTPCLPSGPTGLGTSALRIPAERLAGDTAERPAGDTAVPELYCPGPVRDNKALGEEVNKRLVAWAEQVGIYPGQLDKVRTANFGRLIMLAHPETDDPDRLLAAAKCALAEWAVDDHYVDSEAAEAHHDLLGQRLAIAHSVIDQAHLPLRYAPQLEEVVQRDPVMIALRSSLDNLATYATTTQVRRLRHELAIMFVAYNQEGVWHTAGQTPPVWEFLMHRHENSFLPCMVLIDAVAGYELPMAEFSDPRVRRAFTMAGSASVIVNDLYSMGKEDTDSGLDFNLPTLIAAEENCSLREAIGRSAEIHDELVRTFEREAAALSLAGSPELRRFMAGVWAWLGGSREWHRTTARYGGDTART